MCNALELHLTTLCYCSSINTQNHKWCNVYVRVNPLIRQYAVHKQWSQISWLGSKSHYLTIKMLYNRCKGIYTRKFGNNIYARHIRCRSNLGHIFQGKKCVLWAGKYTNCVKKTSQKLNWMLVGFAERILQFSLWTTTRKDISEACAIACQNCSLLSFSVRYDITQ
jgi:hypothetical protein